MKTFGQLDVCGPPTQIAELRARLLRALEGDGTWSHDLERDQWAAKRGGAPLLCVARKATGAVRAALVWAEVSEGDGTLSVRNVVPEAGGAFSHDEYNEILADFHKRWVHPLALELNLREVFTTEEVTPREAWGPLAADKLERFARGANRASGAEYPEDRARWHEFIVTAHRQGTEINAPLLARWLHEEAGFPADVAHELASEYEHARALLVKYDSEAA